MTKRNMPNILLKIFLSVELENLK